MMLITRRSTLVASLFAVGCAAGEPVDVGLAQENLVQIGGKRHLAGYNSPQRVCWDFPGFDTEKGYIRDAVTRTWQGVAGSPIRFQWDDCRPGSPYDLKIISKDGDDGHQFYDPDKSEIDLMLRYVTDPQLPGWCGASPESQFGCIGQAALHEFGHFLGYAHEQDRFLSVQDAVAHGCPQPAPNARFFYDYRTRGIPIDISEPIDLDSIMSYCRTIDGPSLTEIDVHGLQKFYPSPVPAVHGRSVMPTPNGVQDVATNPVTGDLWILTGGIFGAPDGLVEHWEPSTSSWTMYWQSGVRIAIAPDNTPWIVRADHSILRMNLATSAWSVIPGPPGGGAVDIAIGFEGSVWIVSTIADTDNLGGSVWRWSGSDWTRGPHKGAAHIAVDRAGKPWITDNVTTMWRLASREGRDPITFPIGTWELVPGSGTDLAVGANGVVWAVGPEGRLWLWNEEDRSWTQREPFGTNYVSVALDSAGYPYSNNNSNQLWRVQ